MSLVVVTATTPGPCACCGIGGVTLYCRSRGGTASLIGCPSVTTTSPPKRFRRAAASGSAQSQAWASDATCSLPPTGTVNCDYSGFLQYDKDTGILTTGGTTICNGVVVGTGLDCPTCPGDSCLQTWTCSETSAARLTTGTCCPVASPGTGFSKDISDSLVVTLSDEDTEEDAIARLLAGAGGVWSSYAPVGDGTGGTCDPSSCCKAVYGQRTTGISFAYAEAQFKAVMTSLDPTTAYVLNVIVYRRLAGSTDPWEQLLISAYGFTTDGSGNCTITDQDVPNLEGWETYACCPLIYKP